MPGRDRSGLGLGRKAKVAKGLGSVGAPTCSLHCSSFLGLPYRILIIYLVKPKKGTTMETIGTVEEAKLRLVSEELEQGFGGFHAAGAS